MVVVFGGEGDRGLSCLKYIRKCTRLPTFFEGERERQQSKRIERGHALNVEPALSVAGFVTEERATGLVQSWRGVMSTRSRVPLGMQPAVGMTAKHWNQHMRPLCPFHSP